MMYKIYLSLSMLSGQDDISASHLHKKPRFTDYKNPMNPLKSSGSQSLLCITYIFSESLSKISLPSFY